MRTSVATNAVKNAFSPVYTYIGCQVERLAVAFVHSKVSSWERRDLKEEYKLQKCGMFLVYTIFKSPQF